MNSKKIYIQPNTFVEHVTLGRLMQVGGSGGEGFLVEEEETKQRVDTDSEQEENNTNSSWGSLW